MHIYNQGSKFLCVAVLHVTRYLLLSNIMAVELWKFSQKLHQRQSYLTPSWPLQVFHATEGDIGKGIATPTHSVWSKRLFDLSVKLVLWRPFSPPDEKNTSFLDLNPLVEHHSNPPPVAERSKLNSNCQRKVSCS